MLFRSLAVGHQGWSSGAPGVPPAAVATDACRGAAGGANLAGAVRSLHGEQRGTVAASGRERCSSARRGCRGTVRGRTRARGGPGGPGNGDDDHGDTATTTVS